MFENLSALLWAGTVLLLCASGTLIFRAMKSSQRQHMDPLPLPILLIWPLVKTLELLLSPWLSDALCRSITQTLRQAGLSYRIQASEFISLQAGLALIAILLLSFSQMILDSDTTWLSLTLAGISGAFLPLLALREARIKREKQMRRDLPVFLDFIIMAVEAGLNLTGGMQQAAKLGPDGPLRQELSIVLRDIRTGLNRQKALRQLADRVQLNELTLLVNALIQAEKSGASMGHTLRIQADQRRTERFQQAEKLAMQAPVKLIFPLIVFIFPVTFLILGFPIVMKFIYEI
ncbi:MAG: type II secretion system F family protein [Hahellaceae bacterium]|nr:type II secretion system F family protein [Hahellaceae bacterium]